MIAPRPEITAIPAVPHGGTTEPGVLDFSANLNPFGPSPAVVEAVRSTAWATYPDPAATRLRSLLAARHDVEPGQILVGNGASELIDLACRAFVRPGDRITAVEPCYGEYARSARLCGGTVNAGTSPPRLWFLCSPHNPLGTVCPVAEIAALADAHPDTLVVVDEAYAECAPGFASAVSLVRPNVLVLRSLTKAHGLAGLRVGYAIGPADVVDALRRVQVPWSVNAVALAAAEATLRDESYTLHTVAEWHHLRNDLVDELAHIGLKPRVAATPFFLVPDPPGEPWAVRLRRHSTAVRDCASFGLPGFARVSPRLAPDNTRLVAAIRAEVTHT